MKRDVLIVHYNTPELTTAAIMSLWKHGGDKYHVHVIDNSDKRPLFRFIKDVHEIAPPTAMLHVYDNTKGDLIDFEKELSKYPDREATSAKFNDWGSDKHMLSIQYAMDYLLPDGFLLMDSDILLKADVDFMFNPDKVAVGHVQEPQPGNHYGIGRIVPMLCYINVPMCRALGIRYFDPERSWMLFPGMNNRKNWYDTGASFLEDIRKQPRGQRGLRIDIRPLMEHYKCGSWMRNDLSMQQAWLEKNGSLWKPTPRMVGNKKVAVCAVGRNENLYAVEWVEHYRKLGVSKIFVYDNWFDGETPLAETLKKYVDSGLVEITDIHNRMDIQLRAYTDCYKKHGSDYGWIGFLDFDEFLRWNGRKKIETMFAKYEEADAVLINWRLMSDNGLVHYDDRPLKQRFTKPMPLNNCVKYDFPENDHVKCFVRGGIPDLFFTHLHYPNKKVACVNAKGEKVEPSPFVRPFDHSVMWIDHYWTKTAEEWRNVKLKRGFSTGREYDKWFMQKQTEFFFKVNERTPEKEAIVNP